MAKDSIISNCKDALAKMQEALGAQDVDFALKSSMAVALLELSLETLAAQGLLSKAIVEVSGSTTEKTHLVKKYTLGARKERDEEGYVVEVPCLKKSTLEEDE